MNYKITVDPNNIKREYWNEFLFSNPNGNFFQSPDYYEWYNSLITQYKAVAVFALDSNDTIFGLLVAVIIKEKGLFAGKYSKRCIIFGGPVVTDNNPEIISALLERLIKEVKKESIYIEFRNLFDMTNYVYAFNDYGFKYVEHFNFIFDVGNDVEETMKKLNANRRRQIRKSIEAGVKIVEAESLDDVKQFYELLKILYNEKVKKPLPNFRFFENFYNSKSLGRYFIVKYNGKVVGGNMCPVFDKTIYELYRTGLDKEYKEIFPSVVATWAPIEYAIKNDLKRFDFLGAGSSETNGGVREFKSQFGGNLVSNGRFLRINSKFFYNLGKLGLKYYKRIKTI